MSKLLGVSGKLAREDAEQLVKDRLGEDELVALVHYTSQRRFAAPAREHERCDEHVGIEDGLQERR